MDIQELYIRELKKLMWDNGMNPDINQLERLSRYACLLVQKNETVNLISRKDMEHVIENHVFISCFISEFVPKNCRRFLDIGTGGGLPGIPFAIQNPLMRGILIDSIGKKCDAVKDFINKLKLSNVQVENVRAENPEFISKNEGTVDLVISRATVPLVTLFKYSLPLLREKGYIASLKGGALDEEIEKTKIKYKSYIKKSTIFELSYKPGNSRNEKDKKLILMEINK